LDQRPSEARLLHLRPLDPVLRDVIDAILWPNELLDPHPPILEDSGRSSNESAERLMIELQRPLNPLVKR